MQNCTRFPNTERCTIPERGAHQLVLADPSSASNAARLRRYYQHPATEMQLCCSASSTGAACNISASTNSQELHAAHDDGDTTDQPSTAPKPPATPHALQYSPKSTCKRNVQAFPKLASLKAHFKSQHSDLPRHWCEKFKCWFSAADEEALQSHRDAGVHGMHFVSFKRKREMSEDQADGPLSGPKS